MKQSKKKEKHFSTRHDRRRSDTFCRGLQITQDPLMSKPLRFACLLALFNVSDAPAAASLPISKVLIAGHEISAEVADDDRERMRGLMFRSEMDEDSGMVFVFDSELPLSFWMKNTRIALDMLYFDADGRLVSIQHDVPPCTTAFCPSYPSEGPARFVLELNAGRARALHIPADALLCEQPPQLTPLPACPP
jgi:uncharacterized membrane protein (UPF0127 family)